jgi:hypothetical protein
MTPIQQHEAELRAMMERAGLKVWRALPTSMDASGKANVAIHCVKKMAEWSAIGFATSNGEHGRCLSVTGPYHPDPRVALRHCLEMAGLLEDRPPRDDGELVAWLVERWGEPVRIGAMSTWRTPGCVIRAYDYGGYVEWERGDDKFVADELGAILWCAERFACE